MPNPFTKFQQNLFIACFSNPADKQADLKQPFCLTEKILTGDGCIILRVVSEADEAAMSSSVMSPPDAQPDISISNSRPQSADRLSCVELSTSLALEPGSLASVTSRQTGSRSHQKSRIVPPRTCVHRHQSRDPAVT